MWPRWVSFFLGAVIGGGACWFLADAIRQRSALLNPGSSPASRIPLEDWQRQGDFVVASGSVDVPKGTSLLSVTTHGRIERILAEEGSHVSAGDPILQLDDSAARAELAKAEAGVREAEIGLAEAKASVESHRLSVEQQRQSISGARAALEGQSLQLQKLESVKDPVTVPELSLDLQRQQVLVSKSKAEVEALRLEQLQQTNPMDAVNSAQAALDRARADVEVAKTAITNLTLRAPSNGTILRLDARPGEVVSPLRPEPLVWFVDDGPRIIRCEVNHRFARQLREGLEVLYYHDESQTLLGKGIVTRCSPWIAEQRQVSQLPFERVDQRTLECIVELKTQPERLWIGERVRVVIQTQPVPPGETAPPIAAAEMMPLRER